MPKNDEMNFPRTMTMRLARPAESMAELVWPADDFDDEPTRPYARAQLALADLCRAPSHEVAAHVVRQTREREMRLAMTASAPEPDVVLALQAPRATTRGVPRGAVIDAVASLGLARTTRHRSDSFDGRVFVPPGDVVGALHVRDGVAPRARRDRARRDSRGVLRRR